MPLRTVNLSDTFDQWRVKTNQISQDVVNVESVFGSSGGLATDDKTSVVAGVNELVTKIGPIDSLTATTKTNLVVAVNSNKSDADNNFNTLSARIGDLNALSTTEKNSTQAAINEVNSSLSSSVASLNAQITSTNSNVSGAYAQVGALNDLDTTEKSNVVLAINDVLSTANTANTTANTANTTANTANTSVGTLTTQVSALSASIGDLSTILLDPADRTSIVNAINRLVGNLVAMNQTLILHDATLVQIRDNLIGNMTTLETEHKTSLVGAINELHT